MLEDSVSIIDDIFKLVEEEERKHQNFQDLLGDVYEYLLRATNEAGKNGQFRTPRHIIQMMAELVAPTIDDPDTKICDVTLGLDVMKYDSVIFLDVVTNGFIFK